MYFPSLLHIPDLDCICLCFPLGKGHFKSNGTLLPCVTKHDIDIKGERLVEQESIKIE
jgi:hypothetical protein